MSDARPPFTLNLTLPGFVCAAMFLVMFTLKLANVTPDLSWWYVIAPLWVPAVLAVVAVGAFALVVCVVSLIAAWLDKKGKD